MADNYGDGAVAQDGGGLEAGESTQVYTGDAKARGKQRHLMN